MYDLNKYLKSKHLFRIHFSWALEVKDWLKDASIQKFLLKKLVERKTLAIQEVISKRGRYIGEKKIL